MIPAFIVLLVIALAGGGYIAYDILYAKKKAAAVDAGPAETVSDGFEQETEEEAEPEAEEPETAENEIAETDDGNDDEVTQIKSVEENGKTRFIAVRYSKSFLAKLIQSDDEIKRYYSAIKNRLLSYGGVKSRMSWKRESFRFGRKTLARLRLRGKTLSLCLALNAEDYADTKYKVESLSGVRAYADTPCMYRIKNERRLRFGEELIAALTEKNGLKEIRLEETDYAAAYPYESTEALIGRKLIKELTDGQAQRAAALRRSEIRKSVTVQEADRLMKDEIAAGLIEKCDGKTDRTKQGIVNIDTLSGHFASGETVTLGEVKKRVKGFHRGTTYLKVLARGTLDKPLTVEADGFSLQAVKMILLTGGRVIKK